jgi:hypothetical protein
MCSCLLRALCDFVLNRYEACWRAIMHEADGNFKTVPHYLNSSNGVDSLNNFFFVLQVYSLSTTPTRPRKTNKLGTGLTIS